MTQRLTFILNFSWFPCSFGINYHLALSSDRIASQHNLFSSVCVCSNYNQVRNLKTETMFVVSDSDRLNHKSINV